MSEKQIETRNLKGTWNQAILTFLFPILLVMSLRWALMEPFVIPSGSMIPNLLIHDHILVQKFAYGLHVPFSNKWLIRWSAPQHGDIVVFKYPENPEIYYIKRLIGVPGDTVEVKNGHITLNGQKLALTSFEDPKNEKGFFYFQEQNGSKTYPVRFMFDGGQGEVQVYKIPQGRYFFMGDNRDQSSDSRVWGYVKEDFIVGKAWSIWLSCDNTLPTMTFVCDPSQIRFERLFKKIQ